MRHTRVQSIGALGLAALSTAFASSCSVQLRTGTDARPPARSIAPGPTGHVTQIDFGRRAAFATCLAPACPAVTPKTLQTDAPPALPTSRPIEPTASLGHGESLVASQAPASPRPAPIAAPAAPQPERSAEPMTHQVTVHFAFGSAGLSAVARASIDTAAGALSCARHVAISGRTDNVGPPQVNEALALARANAVREHLRSRYPNLAPAPAVTLEAKGVCCFAATNDTAQGRALNRRVEVVFVSDTEDL